MSEDIIKEETKRCLNCGTELKGRYCSNCGQRDLPARQDLKDLLINFVSSFYSFESKFFLTFQYLLFKPGKIVEDYNAGKRESYYHPARMYVFLSFIFFLLFSIVASTDKIEFGNKDGKKSKADSLSQDSIKAAVRKQLAEANIPMDDDELNSSDYDSASVNEIDSTNVKKKNGLKFKYKPLTSDSTEFEPKTVEQYDSIQNTLPENKRDNFIERYFTRKGILVETKAKKSEKEFVIGFLNDMLDNTPRMIFFLMPLFALMLKMLYFRRDHYYSEHLVFTVFFYDFIYMAGSLIILLSFIDLSWIGWVQGALYIWIGIYLYKSMRRVYKQRRAKTIIKFLILNILFLICVTMGIIGLGIIALVNV